MKPPNAPEEGGPRCQELFDEFHLLHNCRLATPLPSWLCGRDATGEYRHRRHVRGHTQSTSKSLFKARHATNEIALFARDGGAKCILPLSHKSVQLCFCTPLRVSDLFSVFFIEFSGVF